MTQYKLSKFPTPAFCRAGDVFTATFSSQMQIGGPQIEYHRHSEEITYARTISWAAHVNFGPGAMAMFLGDDTLPDFIRKTFPDAVELAASENLY